MTMPGSRTIEVDGETYSYVLKKAKHYQMPDLAVRLVVLFRPGRYVNTTFKRRAPMVFAPTEFRKGPAQETGFTPALVRDVLRALEFHQGKLPDGFEAGQWRLVGPEDNETEAGAP